MLDRRQFANLPWGFVFLILAIAFVGVLTVYSATYTTKGPSQLYFKQLIWMAIGLVIMLSVMIPDYHAVARYAYVLYAVSIVFLVLVMFMGRTGMGAQRWLAIGPFAFQPSELAKISLVLALTRYFAEDPKRGGYDLRDLTVPAIMTFVPFILVLKQPDLGTAMMLFMTASLIVMIAGIKLRAVLIVALAGAVLAAAVFLVPPIRNKIWGKLKPYQQNRIRAFIDPSSDPLGSGYHANQSKIAVGSGQLTGKGYRKGTQSQMQFLPERHTDFIFAVISEELGFIGSSALVLLYLALLLTGVDTAKNAKDRLGALMAGGVTCMLSLYVFINVGMAVGIVPVVGVPLPLMSYGGTAVIATFLSIGLLLNIQTRRFQLFY